MSSFNKVLLMGNLTRDPAMKYLPSQTAVAEFGVACSRTFTKDGEKREEVTFVDVTAFGKQAELVNEHFQKGKAIFIEGRLKFDSWDDKNGGGKRSKLTVVMENFQFVGDRQGGGERDGGYDTHPQTRRPYSKDREREAFPAEDKRFKEADIPF
jgi:single-strand DNA-binding protein